MCVCVCLSVTSLAKEPFRQNDGLKADIYATCRITFTFMSAVVLETAVSTIYSATSYYSLHVQYTVFFRVLPCVIAAPVYYAVFFRVILLLHAYYDSLVPDPGSRSRLQPRAQHRALCAGCSVPEWLPCRDGSAGLTG